MDGKLLHDCWFHERGIPDDVDSLSDAPVRLVPHYGPPSVTDDSLFSVNWDDEGAQKPVHIGDPLIGFLPAHQDQQKHIEHTVLYDWRNRGDHDFVAGEVVRNQFGELASKRFGVKSNVMQETNRAEGMHIVVLGAEDTEKYLQVKLASHRYYCLRTQHQDIEKIADELIKIRDHEAERRRDFHRKEAKAEKKNREFALLRNRRFVTISDILKLPNLAVFELLPLLQLVWRICYHYKVFYDKSYLLQCSSLSSLECIKRKFLALFQRSEEKEEEVSIDSVWFTQGKNVVTEALLQQTFWSVSDKSANSIKVTNTDRFESCVDEVYVHFQPPDALRAEVIFHSDKTVVHMGMLILPPEPSASYVRQEVAKTVVKEPESLKILFGNVKLDYQVNLRHALPASGLKITVTAKQKIKLSVTMEPLSLSGEETVHGIAVHTLSKVEVLKKELCRLTGIPSDMVDLFFKGKTLDEESTFSEYRLREGDRLEGRVFPWRRTLIVRMPDRQWRELTVDDCRTTCVGQVKVFCQSLSSGDPVHSCEVTAIAGDRVLSDAESLEGVTAGPSQRLRLLLADTGCICFTAATAFNGTYIACICASPDQSHFDQVSLMHNGTCPYYGGRVEASEVLQMVQERRHSPQQSEPVTGICQKRILQPNSAMMPTSSSSPSSEACQASASKLNEKPAQADSPQGDRQERPESPTDSQPHTSPQRKKKSSRVSFYTGSPPPETDTAYEEPRAEADVPLTTDGKDTEDGITEGEARVPNQHASVAERKNDKKMLTELRKRSKSCSSLTRRPSSLSLSGDAAREYESDSVLQIEAGVIKRVTVSTEHFYKKADGTWFVDSKVNSTAQLTPELVQQRLSCSPGLPPCPQPVGDVAGGVEQNTQLSQIMAPDPAFNCIRQPVVQYVAEHLGREGLMIIRALGVSEDIINQASEAHPKNLVEKYYYCLRKWCCKDGQQASKEALREALEKGERRDLALGLDKVDPQPMPPLVTVADQTGPCPDEQKTDSA